MNTQKNRALLAGILVIGLVFSLFTITPVNAQTIEQQIANLLAQIQILQNQLGQLGGGTNSCTFTRNLTIGSTGADVTCLQNYLKGTGHFTFAGGATGYFGPATKSALSAWQATNGVSPAVGYFGPVSQAKYKMLSGTSAPLPLPTTSNQCPVGYTAVPLQPVGFRCDQVTSNNKLKGGAGDIESVEFISRINNEEVGEGQKDIEIAGYEIEAAKGSDIEITAVTLDFDNTLSVFGSDEDFDDYADEVSVWFNGDEVARVDASTFDDDNNYRRSVSLKSEAIIRAGKTDELIVRVSGVKNLDSGNEGEKWNVGLISLRFRDAQNAIITYSSGTDMESAPDNNTTTDSDERQFSFESFASAANVELRISTGDKSINDARTISVDSNKDTNGVEFFSFMMEARGSSDIEIKDLPIFFTATGANVGDIINSAELLIDGKSFGSENISISSTMGTTTFDNIDYVIKAGKKVKVTVEVDINDLGGSFTEGDTLKAEIGETQTDSSLFDAEDEKGNNLADGDKVGSASTDEHTFYEIGFQISFVNSSNTDISINGDDNDYTHLYITFDITAFGEDIYIPNVLTAVSTSTSSTGSAPSTSQGIGYHVQLNSSADLPESSIQAVVDSTTADEKTNSYLIKEGRKERFTVRVTIKNSATDVLDGKSLRVILTGINFAGTDSSTGDSIYTANIQNVFRSPYGFVAN